MGFYFLAVDSATAALIGAGAASVVAIGSQFLADHLAHERDRKNQKRDRLHRVITEAAEYLYKPDEDVTISQEEWDARERHPESVAARHPEMHRNLLPQQVRMGKGIALLQVHLGHGDPLVSKYTDAAAEIIEIEREWIEHLQSDDETAREAAFPGMLDALRKAQIARDRWMREARAEVEKI